MTAPTEETQIEILQQLKKLNRNIAHVWKEDNSDIVL
jgi:hypothetical protein